MTGYTTLDAYEQFCENYENYALNLPLIAQSLGELAPVGAALGVGVGATGLGMGIKGSLTKKALEEAAAENLLKGGLAGAGLVGAGVLGTKLAKKLLKKKRKKPFNTPSFSEYYDEFAMGDALADPDNRDKNGKIKRGVVEKRTPKRIKELEILAAAAGDKPGSISPKMKRMDPRDLTDGNKFNNEHAITHGVVTSPEQLGVIAGEAAKGSFGNVKRSLGGLARGLGFKPKPKATPQPAKNSEEDIAMRKATLLAKRGQ